MTLLVSPFCPDAGRCLFSFFFKKERYFTLSDSLITDFLLVKIVPDDVYQFDNGERCLLTPGGTLKASPNPQLRWTDLET